MRHARPLLIAGLLAAALTTGAILSYGGDDPPTLSPAAPSAASRSTDAAQDASRGIAAAEAGAFGENGLDSHGEGPDPVRQEVESAAAADAPRVLVVRGAPAVPAVEVEVRFTTNAMARKQLGRDLPKQRYLWPERCGQYAVTDEDGIAVLPETDSTWLVSASAEGEFGVASVRPGDTTVTLTLRADEHVTIAVNDTAGSPLAAAPIDLLQHAGGREDARVIWTGHTGRDGRVVVPHFQYLRDGRRGSRKERFAAALRLVRASPVFAEFQGRPVQEEPVALIAPPRVLLEVRLTDHRGTPLLSPATITLNPERDKKNAPPFPVPGRATTMRKSKPTGDVPVRFEWVADGARIRPNARFAGVAPVVFARPFEVRLPAAGEGSPPSQQFELRLTKDFVVLAGRLLLDTGKPLANFRRRGVVWRGVETTGIQDISTVADGRFDTVRRARETGEHVLELHHVVGTNPEAPFRRVGCRHAFSMPTGGERGELGDIVLTDLPLLCTGLVLDDRGEPVPRALVIAQRKQARPPRASENRQARGNGRRNDRNRAQRTNPRSAQPEVKVRWRNVPLLHARTDESGRFELRGTRPDCELRVQADTKRHLAAAAPWLYEGQELRIRIERNGVIRGRVLLPRWMPNDLASLTLQPFDESLRREQSRTVKLSPRRGGRFEIDPVRTGRYDAILRLRNLGDPILTIPDVFVRPGPTSDPRLATLDLRDRIFRYRLRAVDHGGNHLRISSPLLMRWKDETGKPVEASFRWQKGRAELFAPSPFVELLSYAPGCRPAVLTTGPGDLLLAMETLVPAPIVLPGARALCGPDRRVMVSAVLADKSSKTKRLWGIDQRTGERFSYSSAELGKGGQAVLGVGDHAAVPVAQNGKYDIYLHVFENKNARSRRSSVKVGRCELRCDGTQLGPRRVPIDAARLRKALAKLAKRPAAKRSSAQQPSGKRGKNNKRKR